MTKTKNETSEEIQKKKEVIVTTQTDVRSAIEKNPDMKWFVIQTYSGKDASAKRSIEERLGGSGLSEQVGMILMPEEKVTRATSKKVKGVPVNGVKIVAKRINPGYLYILAKTTTEGSYFMDEHVYHIINGSNNLHAFIGQNNTELPKAMFNPLELNKMISQLQETNDASEEVEMTNGLKFKVDAEVTFVEGAYAGLSGKISAVDSKKDQLVVDVFMFGRATPVNAPFRSVEICSN